MSLQAKIAFINSCYYEHFRPRSLLSATTATHNYHPPTAFMSELVNSTSHVLTKKKRGPKPKKISERHFNSTKIKPKMRQQHTWGQAQKIKVLSYLHHYQIPTPSTIHAPLSSTSSFHLPTQAEASKQFGVPQRTISEWIKNKENIESLGDGSHKYFCASRNKVHCKWPELESKLYERFLAGREKGQPIRREWFRRHSMEIFLSVYLNAERSDFIFSNGWFYGFLERHRISLRAVTKKAQKVSFIPL